MRVHLEWNPLPNEGWCAVGYRCCIMHCEEMIQCLHYKLCLLARWRGYWYQGKLQPISLKVVTWSSQQLPGLGKSFWGLRLGLKVNVFAVLVDRHKKCSFFKTRGVFVYWVDRSEVNMYTIFILTQSTKCGKCFGCPKGSFSAKRHEITCKKDINVIFARKSFKISSLVGTIIKQHVFNGHKYTLNSAKASINIYAVWIFPPIPKIYIHRLVHFPVYLCLPLFTLFCGDQPKRQIHSPLASGGDEYGILSAVNVTICIWYTWAASPKTYKHTHSSSQVVRY
jgi:hypothetical protein